MQVRRAVAAVAVGALALLLALAGLASAAVPSADERPPSTERITEAARSGAVVVAGRAELLDRRAPTPTLHALLPVAVALVLLGLVARGPGSLVRSAPSPSLAAATASRAPPQPRASG
jgi:hypothetical protein